MKALILKRGEERRLRAGHLWVFSNEIDVSKTPLTDFAPGEEASVLDSRGLCYGSALVTPSSLICARLYSREKDAPLDAGLLQSRIQAAADFRCRCLGSNENCRLVYGEGDFLPGLVVDRFGSHLAIQISTAGMERRKGLIKEALEAVVAPSSIFWANNLPSRALEQLSQEAVCDGEVPEELEIPEGGCVYCAPAVSGQKTGWYYDQRLNRAYVAKLCSGLDVLDAFSYVGGFGVAAGKGGAKSVTFLDASKEALGFASKNLARNAQGCHSETLQGDAFELLQALSSQGRRFDVVSIDPPAFIKRRKDFKDGLNAYRRLNSIACSLVKDGGLLVSSSCSQHLSFDELKSCLAHAAAKHRMLPRLVHAGFQGPDHPAHASMPETSYLKCLAVQLQR